MPSGSEPLGPWPLHKSEGPIRQPGYVAAVTTFALIRGGGGSAWDWHLVAPALYERGQQAVAVDLPLEDESAGRGSTPTPS